MGGGGGLMKTREARADPVNQERPTASQVIKFCVRETEVKTGARVRAQYKPYVGQDGE